MTVSLSRSKGSPTVKVTLASSSPSGSLTASSEEELDHLRNVWGRLGRMLDQAEKEKQGA